MRDEKWTLRAGESREALQERAIEAIENRGDCHGEVRWTREGLTVGTEPRAVLQTARAVIQALKVQA